MSAPAVTRPDSRFDAAAYHAFLQAKVVSAPQAGFDVAAEDLHENLKPHTRDAVRWALRGGRRALFLAFGLHKTRAQLECGRQVIRREPEGLAIIVIPLGVRDEFRKDAAALDVAVEYVRNEEEAREAEARGTRLVMTNYERVRDGSFSNAFLAALLMVSLDEASVLRGFGGTKTFRVFMRLFEHVRFRFVATATPSPNEYIELLAYAAFLGIMDVGEAKTRFFKRNSEKADTLTIHPHKEREFWLWCASWGLFLQRPSDLGYSDDGYALPEVDVRWHEVSTDHADAGEGRDGQMRLLRDAALSIQDTAREKNGSLAARVRKLMEVRAEDPGAHRVLWHDLENERRALEAAIPGLATVYGTQDLEDREATIRAFADGEVTELGTKPILTGSGTNLQRHCAWAIYLGIGFKFNDFIQSVHRLQRFMQTRRVRIDLIYTEAERRIRQALERRWRQHREMMQKMSEIIREHGLADAAMADALSRSFGVKRVEVRGPGYILANNDTVPETASIESDSLGMILTSLPFSTQYEYTPSYHDFGHTDDNPHFWAQMDFLTPELLRGLQPGRVCAVHVKDRIVPGGINHLGFQTVHPFSDECVAHFRRHGFAFLARKTVVTDVVRENSQTYRLGWSEQCKDGSRMGCGMPEYVLLFRKPPTDRSDGYADVPVVKGKPFSIGDDGRPVPFDRNRRPMPGSGYSRGRWQLDAHGFTRSSGDRLLTHEELRDLPHDMIYRVWREHNLNAVYNFEHHVRIAEELDAVGKLPPAFMLIPPHSWHEDVWSDVARMLTMNTTLAQDGKEMHLCPLQFDIVDRLILQFTMEGEEVYDPFGGVFTVPYRAVKLRRRGRATELNPAYFADGVAYTRAAAEALAMPSLFDLVQAEDDASSTGGGERVRPAPGPRPVKPAPQDDALARAARVRRLAARR